MSNTELLQRRTSGTGPVPGVGAGAPDPDVCEVGGLVPGFDAGWCLVRPIPYCPHGFIYGDGFLCRHPEIRRIIERTQARKASAQPPQPNPTRLGG